MPSPTPTTLWVVATPIGNLGDLSVRARAALEGAALVLCEDTRRTRELFSALGLQAPPLERLDAHTDLGRVQALAERLAGGAEGAGGFALVTDAGTPGVSDPAAALVRAARTLGCVVSPIPGPSAVTALVSVAGFSGNSFSFQGFYPRSGAERADALRAARAAGGPSIWFESPERILDAVESLVEHVSDVELVCAKELTKLHERVLAGMPGEVLKELRESSKRDAGALRGEWCFALRFTDVAPASEAEDSGRAAAIETALKLLIEAGVAASDAARRISAAFSVPKNEVYEMALKISGKK